jgi:hypothetical protein
MAEGVGRSITAVMVDRPKSEGVGRAHGFVRGQRYEVKASAEAGTSQTGLT